MYDKLNKFEKLVFDVLSVALVLFYSYSAVLQPAATQYHRGIYVIITYVLAFLLAVAASELLHAPCRVDVLAAAGVEGMVGAVDFRDVAVLLHRRARLVLGAVGKPYGDHVVFGVDAFSHSLRARPGR